MSRRKSPEVGKSESPEDSLKSEVASPKRDEENTSAPPIGGPHSEINNSEIENPTSEIETQLTANSKLPTENTMEVHHHPDVEKKGLKEYVLEGLMIFLAVTMGFFAESLQERINENNRAKEYAVTLYSDLKADTANLDQYITHINFGVANADTLMQLLSANDPKDIPSGKLYWYGLFGGMRITFAAQDATLLEMKNSGSLRYFTNPAINRLVAEYDQRLQYLKTLDEHGQGIYTEVRKVKALLFNFKYNDAANTVSQGIYRKYKRASIDSFINTNPPLLSTDKVVFNQFVELVRSRFLKTQAANADSLNHHAIALIGALKKEYGLQDE
ncbi:MAG TPA: hypothetical protein VIJ27_05140 [Mucilaginibacter sp.]